MYILFTGVRSRSWNFFSHNSYSGFKSNIFLGGTGIPPTNARTVEGIYLKPDPGRHAVEDFNEPKVHSINTWT